MYEGDVLETERGSFAVVVFRDNSRVTLQSGTRFKVEEYKVDPGKKENVFFKLYKGGVRVFTGWIAKRNAKAFKIGTPTAVVGVRGTLFDLLSTVGLTPEFLQELGIDPSAISAEGGMVLWVRDGSVFSTNAAGTFEHAVGQAIFMAGVAVAPLVFPEVPNVMRENPTPSPELIEVDVDILFSGVETDAPKRLYVSVREGNVVLTPEGGEELVIPSGKAAMLTGLGAEAVILQSIPDFMIDIQVPMPETVPADIKDLFGGLKQEGAPPGLYVSVKTGHVVMTSETGTLHLGAGEAGFWNPQENLLTRLAEMPSFQANDPLPRPQELDDWLDRIETRIEDTFDIPASEGPEDCECEIVY